VPQAIAELLGRLVNIKFLRLKWTLKIKLLNFNRTDIFLYEVMVSENDVLETMR